MRRLGGIGRIIRPGVLALLATLLVAGPAGGAEVTGTPIAEHPLSAISGHSTDAVVLQHCYDTPAGQGTTQPRLLRSCMVVWGDDPSTAADDTGDLYLEAYTSGPTLTLDRPVVSIDTTGDGVAEHTLTAPTMPRADTWYAGTVRTVTANGKGRVAKARVWWARVTPWGGGGHGYVAVVEWRRLGLTQARISYRLSHGARDWSAVPGQLTGPLVALPAQQRPSAPQAVRATAGSRKATISWTPPVRRGSSAIARYVVASVPAGAGCTTKTTSCVVSGLTPGRTYTFRVRAVAAAGASPWSAKVAVAVPRAALRVAVGTRSRAGKLFVNVDPDRGRSSWRFTVQRRSAAGKWVSVRSWSTQGARETRTINLPRGTYRVLVPAQGGHTAAVSRAVTLLR